MAKMCRLSPLEDRAGMGMGMGMGVEGTGVGFRGMVGEAMGIILIVRDRMRILMRSL